MIFVIIATCGRNNFLKERSLFSVYCQKNIDPSLVAITSNPAN